MTGDQGRRETVSRGSGSKAGDGDAGERIPTGSVVRFAAVEPLVVVLVKPVAEGGFHADVVAHFLGLVPFVTEDLAAFLLEEFPELGAGDVPGGLGEVLDGFPGADLALEGHHLGNGRAEEGDGLFAELDALGGLFLLGIDEEGAGAADSAFGDDGDELGAGEAESIGAVVDVLDQAARHGHRDNGVPGLALGISLCLIFHGGSLTKGGGLSTLEKDT
jgi:hypothetical protein